MPKKTKPTQISPANPAKILKITSLASAQKEMEQLGVSKAGARIMAPKMIFAVIKISSVRNALANILKQECLSCGADAAVHWKTVGCKIKETDVLVFGTIAQLSRIGKKMLAQPSESPGIGKSILAAVAKISQTK